MNTLKLENSSDILQFLHALFTSVVVLNVRCQNDKQIETPYYCGCLSREPMKTLKLAG